MPESLEFSTQPYRQDQRFTRYRDFYSGGADTIGLGGPVSATITAWRLLGLIAYERRVTALGAERDAERVRRNGFDHFTLQLNLGGVFHGEGANGFCLVQPGELLLLDMGKPMRTRMPDVHLITLSLPRTAVQSASTELGRLHGLVIPADLGFPLARHLSNLPNKIDIQSPMKGPEEITLITDLLRLCLNRMGLGGPPREGAEDVRLTSAQRFIREHLCDDDLDPARVARAVNLSRATLYRVFDTVGGVVKYIQAQRLARLKESLSDPFDAASVSALAHEAGFVSETHANRSFKQLYGLPPAEFRRGMKELAERRYGAPQHAAEGRLLSWYISLSEHDRHGLLDLTSAA